MSNDVLDSAALQTARSPQQRWRVVGRNRFFGCIEIGYFFGSTPLEAVAEARRRKAHLLSGLKLEAEARL